ncbi:hypothetical protein ACLB2K_011886 [Fragaria x ananassa]
MITGEARVICRRFGENVLGDVIEKVLVFDRVVNLSGCLATKDNCNPAKLESKDNSVEQEVEIVIMGGSKVQQQFVSEPISSVPINYDMCVCSMMIVIWPKKICHYVLLPCSSGFDKKVSDKDSGRSLLTGDLLVLDKESTGMWLWVSLSIWIAAIRPLWKPGNAYTKVFSSSTNFGFRALDVVETIVKSQSCWEEFCLMIDGISEKAAQVVHELSSSSKKVRVLHFYSNTTGNERTFAQATVLEHPSSFEVILLVSNKSGNSSKRIFTLIISLIELWKYGYVEKNMRWLTKISVTSFGKECLKYYHGQGLIFSVIKLETLSFYSTDKFDKMEGDVTMRWKSTIIAANDYCTEELREIFLENHMKLDGKCLGYVFCALELVKKLAIGPNLGDSVCIDKFPSATLHIILELVSWDTVLEWIVDKDAEQVTMEVDKGVVTMRKGEIALLIMFSEYAVGALEAWPALIVVPPHSTLLYVVEPVFVIVVKDKKFEVASKEKEGGVSSNTIRIMAGIDDGKTFDFHQSAYVGVQVHVEDRLIEMSNTCGGNINVPNIDRVVSHLGITTFFASVLQQYGHEIRVENLSAYFPPNMYDIGRSLITVPETVGSVLCCKCGISLASNGVNMCFKCLPYEVDITAEFRKQVAMVHSFECDTFLQPPGSWIKTPLELNELLAFYVGRLKNLNKLRTDGVDAVIGNVLVHKTSCKGAQILIQNVKLEVKFV